MPIKRSMICCATAFFSFFSFVACVSCASAPLGVPFAMPESTARRVSPPANLGVYTYHGVQVFNGAAGVPDDTLNADISGAPSDPNSSNVITNEADNHSLSNFTEGSSGAISLVNVDNGGATFYTVSGVDCESLLKCIWPFNYSSYAIEGLVQNSTCEEPGGGGNNAMDCHYDAISTSTHRYYFGYHANFDNTTQVFSAGSGATINLDATLKSQINSVSGAWGDLGWGALGFEDVGEDAQLTAIPHPLRSAILFSQFYAGCVSGINYASGGGCGGGTTCTDQTKCLLVGDVLILKSGTYSSCTSPDAVLLVSQLQHSGTVISDGGKISDKMLFARASDGSNPWDDDSNVAACIASLKINTSNWRLLDRHYFPL